MSNETTTTDTNKQEEIEVNEDEKETSLFETFADIFRPVI